MNYGKKRNDIKMIDALSEYKVKCENCGHIVILITRKKCICNWCGHMIYRNNEERFKDKLKEALSRKK